MRRRGMQAAPARSYMLRRRQHGAGMADNILIGRGDRPCEMPALPRQPARAGGRRHRHRQDRDPADPWPRASPAPGSRCSAPTSRATCRASPARASPTRSSSPRPRPRRRRISPRGLPGGVLGRLRPAGPPVARHRGRDGPAAAGPHARAQRHPGGRAQHRLQAGRRRRAAAARLQGPARHPRPCRGARGRAARPLRPGQQDHHRHHPAPAAGAGTGGRRAVLRRAGPGAAGPDAATRRPRRRSTCWPPTS